MFHFTLFSNLHFLQILFHFLQFSPNFVLNYKNVQILIFKTVQTPFNFQVSPLFFYFQNSPDFFNCSSVPYFTYLQIGPQGQREANAVQKATPDSVQSTCHVSIGSEAHVAAYKRLCTVPVRKIPFITRHITNSSPISLSC